MNAEPTPSESTSEEQASLWAVRMESGTLPPEQREELTRWLEASPSHRDLLRQYCQFSQDLEPHLLHAVRRGAIHVESPRRARAQWKFLLPWVGASFAAAALAVAVFQRDASPGWEARKVATAGAQRQEVVLVDGTRVELSALTSLEVQESKTERRVRLASGEAYFRVAKDATRPFIVETPSGAVRVTGTVFDVRAQANHGMEVTVEEGSVQVSPASVNAVAAPAPVNLKAGDRLVADAKGVNVLSLNAEELEAVLAWRQGQVVFDNTPLRDAVNRFALYHGRGVVTSEDVSELRLGGRHNLEDMDGFMANLEALLPVEVSRSTNGTIRIVSRPSER